MNDKILAVLLQIVKALQVEKWTAAPDWELTLKGEGHIPLIRTVIANGSLDQSKWQDQIQAYIDLKLASEDEWTYFPEFTLHAQIEIGDIPSEDIAYKMQSNNAFTDKDVKDEKKAASTAREITRLVESHIGEVYQDYVDKNEEVVRFYKQESGEAGGNGK